MQASKIVRILRYFISLQCYFWTQCRKSEFQSCRPVIRDLLFNMLSCFKPWWISRITSYHQVFNILYTNSKNHKTKPGEIIPVVYKKSLAKVWWGVPHNCGSRSTSRQAVFLLPVRPRRSAISRATSASEAPSQLPTKSVCLRATDGQVVGLIRCHLLRYSISALLVPDIYGFGCLRRPVLALLSPSSQQTVCLKHTHCDNTT